MDLNSFTLNVTDQCNFNCRYCPQTKEKIYMSTSFIEKTLDFFYPFFNPQCTVNFYGGEPLLAFRQIQHTVQYLETKQKRSKKESNQTLHTENLHTENLQTENLQAEKRIQGKEITYSMTTNGSLIDDAVYQFLLRKRFSLMISFDGLAHNRGRKEGDFDRMTALIKRFTGDSGFPAGQFSTNSVFTPETVHLLSASLKFIMELGVTDIQYNLCKVNEWKQADLETYREQLTDVNEWLLTRHRQDGVIPVTGFVQNQRNQSQKEVGKEVGKEVEEEVEEEVEKKEVEKKEVEGKGKEQKGTIFGCFAAQDRMAVSADGLVWGCYLFPDFFKDKGDTQEFEKYSLGRLDTFIKNHAAILGQKLEYYKDLNQKNFYTDETFCFLCEEVESCSVCPVYAAQSGSVLLGKIPPWTCAIHRIEKQIKADFRKAAGIG